jgi:hypothetical protein
MRRAIPAIIAIGAILAAWGLARAQQQPAAYVPLITRPANETTSAITKNLPNGVTAHSGQYASWFREGTSGAVSRSFQLPQNTVYISYWIWVRPNGAGCSEDFASIAFEPNVGSPEFQAIDPCEATNGWVRRDFNVGLYQGEFGLLLFGLGTQEDAVTSEVFFDDIGVR